MNKTNRIKELCKKHNVKMSDIAEKLNVSRVTISNYANNKTTLNTLVKDDISTAIGCHPLELIKYKGFDIMYNESGEFKGIQKAK